MRATKLIWLIGSPRSGTTMLCDYIGKYTDAKFNEPWMLYPIESPRLWEFPETAKTIVFKYCENWRNIHVLMNRYPNAVWVHCWRDPDNVVYSMAHPKAGSYPRRDLYGGHKDVDRERLCMQRWYSNMMHSLSIYNILPSQYLEISYENMKPGIERLSEQSGVALKPNELEFSNRNVNGLELNWELNPTSRELRNLIMKYDGEGSLAQFVNKKKPKLLQRVVL